MKSYVFGMVAILAAAVFADRFLEQASTQSERQNQRLDLVAKLDGVRARMGSVLEANLLVARGLVAEISLNPEIDQDRFALVAQQLTPASQVIRHVAASRDWVLSHIHPLEPNRAVLGIDLRNNPEQRDAILKAVKSRGLVLAGPLNLVQGGRAFVARSPVFATETRNDGERPLWGLVAVVLEYDLFFQECAVASPAFDLAVIGVEEPSAPVRLIYGSPEVMKNDPVRIRVPVAGGYWELAAVPPGGWVDTSQYAWSIRGGVASVAMLCMLLLTVRRQQLCQAVRSAAELRRSESKMAAAFHQSPLLMAISGTGGVFVDVNQSFIDASGYSREELLGKSAGELGLIDEKTQHRLWRHFETKDKVAGLEVVLIPKQGRPRYCRFFGSAIEHGDTRQYLTILQDFTDLRDAEQSARENFLQLCKAQTLARIASFTLDPANRSLVASSQLADLLGMNGEELTADSLEQRIHPDDREEVARGRERAFSCNQSFRADYRILRPDGTQMYVQEHSELETDSPSSPRVLGAILDVTDRTLAEQERRNMERRILQSQKLESLGVLAGGVAHDFNNLLVAILGYADLAAEDLPPGSSSEQSIQEIRRAAVRAADLTNQMLAFSGKGRFVVQSVNLNAVAKETVQLLRASISNRVTLSFSLAENLPEIEADASQIQQVVMNLVTNAAEASPESDGAIQISTGVEHLEKEALAACHENENAHPGPHIFLEVSDTGVGMEPSTLQKLFEPFFTTKFSGRGLGLAGVLGIVRGHRGAISVKSELGRGTTIRVYLPASSKSDPAGTADSANGSTSAARDTQLGVLVADDEAPVRELATTMLQRCGYQVHCAEDGASAVERLKANADGIDLVLLDMTMPGLTGEQTCRELLQLKPDLHLILMSGYSEVEVRNAFEGQRLSGFLQKPFTFSQLKSLVQSVLANGRSA